MIEAQEVDAGRDGLAARRRQAQQLAAVAPSAGPAGGDRIAFGDQLVDGHADVAERQVVEEHQLAEGVGAAHEIGGQRHPRVHQAIGRDDLVGDRQVAAVPQVLAEAPGDLLVAIGAVGQRGRGGEGVAAAGAVAAARAAHFPGPWRATIPLPSSTVTVWLAATRPSFCLTPLGQSISRPVTSVSRPSPKVWISSLCEQ